MTIKMVYFQPDRSLIGKRVVQGEVIGTARDIAEKYPGITPHVHLEISAVNPELLMEA